jgi:hypothetical protein
MERGSYVETVDDGVGAEISGATAGAMVGFNLLGPIGAIGGLIVGAIMAGNAEEASIQKQSQETNEALALALADGSILDNGSGFEITIGEDELV